MSNVLAFLSAHWLAAFSVWVALNAIASTLEDKLGPVPTNTWYGKALHVFVAISPMDVMKALKALGGALVPPSAGAMLVLLGCLSFGVVGCGSATPAAQDQSSVQIDPRALANATTSLIEKAWKASAQACIDSANAANDQSIRHKCEPVLTKTRNAMLAAQSAVDLWDAASQKNFPCLVGSAVEGLGEYVALGGKVPQAVTDGINIAKAYVGQCVPAAADAGVQ